VTPQIERKGDKVHYVTASGLRGHFSAKSYNGIYDVIDGVNVETRSGFVLRLDGIDYDELLRVVEGND